MKKLDDIHIDYSPIDGREKAINLVMTSRHDGKTTTFLCKKQMPVWRKKKAPLVLLFRNICDMNPSTLNYYCNLMNPFMDQNYKVDVRGGEAGTCCGYFKKEPFFYGVALNTKEYNLKKTAFPGVDYVLFDELEINPKNKEKYLTNEFDKFQAYFDTQLKITPKAKFYGLTNPYSLVNPYFRGLGVDTSKLKLGTMLTGKNWAVWYKRMNPLLVEKIKKEDPLFSEEGEYAKMAFSGLCVNDLNNHVKPMEGQYRLFMVFTYQGIKYGVYKLADWFDNTRVLYYIKEERDSGERRRAYAFEFEDLICNNTLASSEDKNNFAHLKMAIRNQDVGFDKIESEHAFQEIYDYL